MKRRRVHALFGLIAMTFGLLAGYQGWHLVHAARINAAIASAAVAELDSTVAEARFARATALSASGDFEGAAKAYKELVQGARADLKQDALLNLGNLHMREALKNGVGGTSAALPLIELAKQNYRDLLRDHPQDWDARFNLERALWLAPEADDQDSAENNVPQWERRVAPRAQGFNVELP